ncbi:alcaligin biosynthesis protein [Flammeovirga pectinis]|uniref:Alcaligin biosynthesis protein n=1 Tax=Flammeovirga pectinis TaxID=2494373 RepID=A0A3S9PBC1_9BACT|nr:SidA/IucD/PvdA family monooxygenase [Flammeovirga pectinis]AZQ65413.1 alcaligin biosynthesis protein [Flammeovirga pectinis]
MQEKIYDIIGVGIGPFNLGLACLTAPIEELDCLFLDQRDKFNWHPGLLLEDTTLQVPFMSDLVTLADPTSPYSFLNYIKQKGKIYSFYIKEDFLLLRNEYNQYCQWVIAQLDNLIFSKTVDMICYNEDEDLFYISCITGNDQEHETFISRKIVLGTGTSPHVPTALKSLGKNIIHTSQYLPNKRKLQEKKAITVVGSGQSAAEVFNDLLVDIDTHKYTLNWITRSHRFFPMEYTKLTLEMTSPEYVDYFYSLPLSKREALLQEQKHLYKGINSNLINGIFDTIYAKKLTSPINVNLRTSSRVASASVTANGIELIVEQQEQGKKYRHSTEAVIMATGYRYKNPFFMEGLRRYIQYDEKDRPQANRNYTIDKSADKIFVQNVELYTHGFVTPDLGMACYRNSYIIKEITGKEYYPIEEKIAFQQFDVTEEEEVIEESII